MRITKFVHSCLLVETPDRVALFDPGQFSWESGLFILDKIDRVDRVIITHEHFDHAHLPFIEAVANKFPDLKIITTPELANQLKGKLRVEITDQSTSCTKIVAGARHESMVPLNPVDPPAQNIAVHFKESLTHPGDSLHIDSSMPVFAMPLAGPWGSAIDAMQLALKLKPKYVLPIHDWMWNEQWRRDIYARMQTMFAENGITFLLLVDGEQVEINP